MTGLFAGLSLVTTGFLWWRAKRDARVVLQALSPAATQLAAQLRRTAPKERLEQAVRLVQAGSWEHALVRAASVADPLERREALSTCLDEASDRLTVSEVARALPRIQGLLAAFFTVGGVALSTLLEAFVAATAGLAGTVAVSVTVQSVAATEQQQRRTVDQLVKLLDPESLPP